MIPCSAARGHEGVRPTPIILSVLSANRATIAHHTVELKRIITKFTYRIEPKPEGDSIPHAVVPTIRPLEAQSRLSLKQKFQANITPTRPPKSQVLNTPAETKNL